MKTFAISFAAILVCIITHAPALYSADQYVVVVLDDSGSMDDSLKSGQGRIRKMEAAKQALVTVLKDVPDSAEVGVLTLNSQTSGTRWIVPLGPIDRQSVNQQVARIRASGGTPLGAAMKDAADALLKKRAKNVYGLYRLLIVTDGEAQDQDLVDRYVPSISARGLTTDVIGVGMRDDHSLATKVTSYSRADDPESLTRAIADVFAETSDQTSDSGDSDYDLLSGLPDEIAAAAIISLTQANNVPVGETAAESQPVAAPDMSASVPGNRAPSGNTSVPRSRDQGTVDQTSSGLGVGFLCCAGVPLLIGAIIFLSILKRATKR